MITVTLLSIVATVSFSILYQIPRKAIIPVGMLGMVSWLFYSAALHYGTNPVVASFVASIVVSLLSEAFARTLRMPVVIFAVPGIVVLLPGMTAYSAMKAFVVHQYLVGISMGTETALVAGALASGIAISGVLAKSIWRKGQHDISPARK